MIAVIVIVIILVVYTGLSTYGAKRAMEIPREYLEVTAETTGLEYEDVAFTSRTDSVLMKGWYFPGGGEKAIIIVNGGFRPRVDENSDTLGLTTAMVSKGYNVLLFDMRGRGESEGKGLELSNIDKDIGGAVDYLRVRGYGIEKICLLGFCSGATQVCLYASRNDIGTAILDGCFLSVPTMAVREVATTGAPEFAARIFIPGLIVMAKLMYGYDLINPIDAIGNIKCPVLLIHEENDRFTSLEETERLYNAVTSPVKEMWEVKESLHSQAFRNFPEGYLEKVDGFLKKQAGDKSAE